MGISRSLVWHCTKAAGRRVRTTLQNTPQKAEQPFPHPGPDAEEGGWWSFPSGLPPLLPCWQHDPHPRCFFTHLWGFYLLSTHLKQHQHASINTCFLHPVQYLGRTSCTSQDNFQALLHAIVGSTQNRDNQAQKVPCGNQPQQWSEPKSVRAICCVSLTCCSVFSPSGMFISRLQKIPQRAYAKW